MDRLAASAFFLGFQFLYVHAASCNFQWQAPDYQYANEGGQFTINCNFTATGQDPNNFINAITWINPGGGGLAVPVMNGGVVDGGITDNWNRPYTFIPPATVQLSAATSTDAGNYTCQVGIQLGCDSGTWTKRIALIIRAPPSKPVITRHQATGLTVREGDSPQLKCMSTTGTPPLTYTWSRGSTTLTGTPDSANTYNILTISSIQKSQQGPYQCSVKNAAGTNTADSVSLDVQYPPGPAAATQSSITKTTGERVTMECTVNSVGNPSTITWQWSTDTSITLPSTTTSQLTLSGLTEDHDGRYYCTPSNSAGAGTRAQITLTVNKAPVISPALSPTQSISVLSQLSIACRVEAKPKATVVWKFNNNPLPAETFTTTSSESTSGKLTVTTLTLAWSSSSTTDQKKAGAGALTCSATNTAVTSPVTNTVNLDVQYPPGGATVDPANVTALEGQPYTLTCKFTDKGNPEASAFDWFRNSDLSTVIKNTASFPISQTALSDAGTYHCRPYNTIGRGDPATITLNVHAPSTLLTNPQNQTVNESDVSVQLTCGAQGKPAPVITWTHGDQAVDGPLYAVQNTPQYNGVTQYDTVTSILTLAGQGRTEDRVTRGDHGYYNCMASNGVGNTAQASAFINVQYRAELHPTRISVREVAADIGSEGIFTLFVIGNPKPITYIWKKTNGSLPGKVVTSRNVSNQDSTLRIPNLQDEDYGVYTCDVLNAAGQAKFIFTLERKGKPDPPSDLVIPTFTAISVILEWTSNKNGGYDQTFIVQYKKKTGGEWQSSEKLPDPGYKQTGRYKVDSLQSETEYVFRVESENSAGSGGRSEEVPKRTKARPVFSKDESKLNVVINGDVATVSWTIESGQEDITSYKIKYCEKETSANCKEHTELNSTATSVDIMVEKGKDYTFTLYVYEGDDLILESQPFKQVTTPENSPSVGGIVGGIVGTISALAVVAVVTVFVMRRRRTQEKKASDTEMAGRSSLVVGNDYNGAAGGVSNPALENGDVEEINPYAESPHVASTNNGRPAIAAKPVIAPKPTKGATGVEGLYAQPDKKKKQEKREPDPSALYAQPEKKKKGKVQDEELKNLYAQPDKNKRKKKKAEPKPSSYEDENPYQNVENQNDLGENPYANVDDERRVQEEEEEEQVEESTKNIGPDGTVYADLAFTRPKGKKPKDEIIRTEEATEYATIDFKRKPPPSD